MIFLGTTKLGYKEEAVWEMTIGKLITLYREYKKVFDLEQSLIKTQTTYRELEEITEEPKEKIVGW